MRDRWNQELALTDEVRIGPSRWRLVGLLLTSVGIVAIGVFLWTETGSQIVRGLCVGFFGLGGVAVAVRLARPVTFRVDRQGVRSARIDLAWDDIDRITEWKVASNRSVLLLLSAEGAERLASTNVRRAMVKADAKVVGRWSTGIAGPFSHHAELVEWLEECRLAYSSRPTAIPGSAHTKPV